MAVDDATAPPEHDGGGGGGIRSEEKVAAEPLLPAPSQSAASTIAPAQDSLEELDRRYAPYARRDAYGPMGRGPVGAVEAARLAVAAAVLLRLRVVAAVLVLVAYYLVCRVCTLWVEEGVWEGGAGEGEGYARLEGWRREGVVRCGRALSRAMMFVFGFYWIREYDCRFPDVEDEHVDQSKDLERPGAIVSNHVSYVDILYHMSSSVPSFVAKRSVSRLPLVGLVSKCLGCIFVQRESKTSDFKGVSGAVTERIQRAH